jgi:hypothetical protein
VDTELALEVSDALVISDAVACRRQKFEPDRILLQPAQTEHPLKRHGKIAASFAIFCRKSAPEEDCHAGIIGGKSPRAKVAGDRVITFAGYGTALPRQRRPFLQAYAGRLPIMETENIVRLLTVGSLAGLLAAVGMRLTVTQVVIALRRRGLWLVVTANFVFVPILVLAATELCGFGFDITIGMILLAAAPFAPVVPVFARMARADLALAAGLTALFPLLSVILTPFVCEMALTQVAHAGAVQFNVSKALFILVATIVVPLCLGLLVKHVSPDGSCVRWKSFRKRQELLRSRS